MGDHQIISLITLCSEYMSHFRKFSLILINPIFWLLLPLQSSCMHYMHCTKTHTHYRAVDVHYGGRVALRRKTLKRRYNGLPNFLKQRFLSQYFNERLHCNDIARARLSWWRFYSCITLHSYREGKKPTIKPATPSAFIK